MGMNPLEVRRRVTASMPHQTEKTGEIVTFKTDVRLPLGVVCPLTPVQDLHGYDYPWAAGAGKNQFNPAIFTATGATKNGDVYSYSTVPNMEVIYFSDNPGQYTLSYEVMQDTTGDVRGYLQFDYSNGTHERNVFSVQANTWTPVVVTSNSSKTLASVSIAYYANNGATSFRYVQLESGSSATSFSPWSNVCPITGHTGAKVTRTGKNLFNKDTIARGKYLNHNTGELVNSSGKLWDTSDYIKIKAGQTYITSGWTTNALVEICFYDEYKVFKTGVSKRARYFTNTGNYAYVRFDLNHASIDSIQLEEGETASAYEPFGNTYPINFPTPPGTVYGGELSILQDGTGVLTVETVYYEFTGDITYTVGTTSTGTKYIHSNNIGVKTSAYPISNMYRGTIAGTQNNTFRNINGSFYVYDNRFTSSEAVSQILTSTPIQGVCEIATPVTYTLTAEQVGQILALNGINNVWSDTGSITVSNIWEH